MSTSYGDLIPEPDRFRFWPFLFPVSHINPFCCIDSSLLVFPPDFYLCFPEGNPHASCWFNTPSLLQMTHTPFPPTGRWENTAPFLWNVRGKRDAPARPMHCSLSHPTPLSGHPSKRARSPSFRWPVFKTCSDILPLTALPKHAWDPVTFDFCQTLTCPSTDEQCSCGIQRSMVMESVLQWNHSNSISPWSRPPSQWLALAPTLLLFSLFLSFFNPFPHPLFERKHCFCHPFCSTEPLSMS